MDCHEPDRAQASATMAPMYRLTESSTLLTALAVAFLAGCPSGGGAGVGPAATESVASEPTPKPASAKLVLSIVLDQMPTSALLRYAPHLPESGVIRRAIDNGLFQERVRYSYAGTNTAPGHASIYTGEKPADHGIDRNDIFVPPRGRLQIVDDGKHAVFGVEGGFASPLRMLKPTIGDLLHASSPESRVVSVSLKARAAVVSAGQTPDFVTWYDADKQGFTTSDFYVESMPPWLAAWNTANPVAARLGMWNPERPELYQDVAGPDDALGESDWYGLGTTFPHDPSKTEKPAKTFVATPASMQYLIDMAGTLVKEFQLGADGVPDLLMLSVSTTDYAGHSFGTSSWEYFDVLIKTDRALTAFVAELERDTELAVVITSDHGGTPIAEQSLAAGKPGGRLYGDVLVRELDALADKALGDGDWLEVYIQPYLYLSEDAKKSEKLQDLLDIITRYPAKVTTVEAIYPAEQAKKLRGSSNWLERDVANTVSPTAEALFVVPAEGHVGSSNEGSLGTGHGTPWDPDREVPVLAFGAGISKSHDAAVVPQERVAPTIAALLNLSWHLEAEALPGAPTPTIKK